mmetsp:Transcript_16795/g.16885  ORF Transcript_16795/g.16885 Transcript_16795/m.16885 type:complete len:102 (+) Transcript_16795:153-458(+)
MLKSIQQSGQSRRLIQTYNYVCGFNIPLKNFSNFSDTINRKEKAEEDMYFRKEDERLMQGLHEQKYAERVVVVKQQLKEIIGSSDMSADVFDKLVRWKLEG